MYKTCTIWIFILLFLGIHPNGNAQLSGVYSIGDSTCTFQTFQEAIDSLQQVGTAGNIYFNANPGVYPGYTLSGYQPTHPSDTVFFQSETMGTNDVIIRGMIRIQNSSMVRFRYLRFEPVNGQQYSCVGVSGPGSVQFDQCAFINPYSNCFTSQEALFSANLPYATGWGFVTLTDCVLSSPAYTIYLSGARGWVKFLQDTISGAIDCFTGGMATYYTNNVFNLSNPSFAYAGQTFRGNTFNGSDLYIQGDFYNNLFYCGVQMTAGKICNNHFFNVFTNSQCPGVVISDNIFEQKFDLIFSSNAIVARNRFFGETLFNSNGSYITGNFFYGFTSCATGPGYQVRQNNFHPDAAFEMDYTSGKVEGNIFGSLFIRQPAITIISNNNYIPGGSFSVNVYGTNPYFYDPQYISPADLHATNPALIRKSVPLDATPGMLYDLDSLQRKAIPTIGANEICFSFQADTVALKCDNLCLDLCPDTLLGLYWTPSSLFIDSTLLSPVIHPGSPCMVYLNKTGVGRIDSVFVDVAVTLPVANGTAVVNDHMVHFTNMSVCADSIRWDFGDGTFANGNDVYHSFPVYGLYLCKLYAFNQMGKDSLSLPLLLTCLAAEITPQCGDSVRLESCLEDFTGFYWYPSYLFKDSTEANPVIYPEHHGFVTLRNVHSTAFAEIYLQVYPAMPVASMTYTIDSLEVQFSDQTKCADSVRWDFGDGTSSTIRNPVHSYPALGVYNGNIYAFSLLGSDTARFSINITGIGSAVISGFEIWPNPAGNYLVIDQQEPVKDYSVFITDLFGRELSNIAGIRGRKKVDLTSFSAGVYLIRVRTDSCSLVKKIIHK
ncbi:MAG: PKD domain-containing protein [Bacteroidota bacterium]